MLNLDEIQIKVIGLGYVGLPLAIEFGKKYPTIGYDVDKERIKKLQEDDDFKTGIPKDELISSKGLVLTSILSETNCSAFSRTIFIITVPTPINSLREPDLDPLIKASKIVGNELKMGDIVIYESTVYPGCTEENCVPILEASSGLIFNRDFFCAYSPERINPGDKEKSLTRVVKVTSGSTEEVADFVDRLYRSIIEAGTFKVSSIKIAEATKLVENCQRDLNISFVNELNLIFDLMKIDIDEVLLAAGTKWNFLKFRPGLVGGHCISIDPYYMIYKSEMFGHSPKLIKASREVNESMPLFYANRIVKKLIREKVSLLDAHILILGFAYKPNSSDIRNTGVSDLCIELSEFGIKVDIYDPFVDKIEVKDIYKLNILDQIEIEEYDMIVTAVPHDKFLELELKIMNDGNVIFMRI